MPSASLGDQHLTQVKDIAIHFENGRIVGATVDGALLPCTEIALNYGARGPGYLTLTVSAARVRFVHEDCPCEWDELDRD